MASPISKTIAARGSILQHQALKKIPSHRLNPRNFQLSSFSSISIDSNEIMSERVRHDDRQPFTINAMDDKSRVRTIRFYRMLLRQCQSLAATTTPKSSITSSKQDTSERFLLQPRVATSAESLYFRTAPPVATESLDLFRLFYILVERENVLKTGRPIRLPPSHPHAIKRSYSSASYAAPSAQLDTSIDDWFFEVTGGQMPVFQNQNGDVDDEMRNLLVNTCWTSPGQLRSVVRDAFKTDYNRIDTPELHKWTLRAIQILQDQEDLWKRSSVAVTDRIRTVATCQLGRCLGALAKFNKRPSKRFTYKIRIENLTQDHLQLMGRSLSIQGIDEDGKAYEAPVLNSKMLNRPYVPSTVLKPGQCFEFVGNVNLKTEKGIVQGCFHMNKVLANSAVAGMEAIPISDVIHAEVAPLELTM